MDKKSPLNLFVSKNTITVDNNIKLKRHHIKIVRIIMVVLEAMVVNSTVNFKKIKNCLIENHALVFMDEMHINASGALPTEIKIRLVSVPVVYKT